MSEPKNPEFQAWFEREFPVDHNGRRSRYRESTVMELMREAWQAARRAVPAQASAAEVPIMDGTFAWAHLAPNGNVRYWSRNQTSVREVAANYDNGSIVPVMAIFVPVPAQGEPGAHTQAQQDGGK